MANFLLVLILGVVCVWAWRASRRPPPDERWRPRALRNAQLVYAERAFRSAELRIVARLDRAYQDRGVITLVEFKTRSIPRAYHSDVIELSAQRIALADETGQLVADIAYVVTQDIATSRRMPHSVRLLSREEVAALVKRRNDLVAGRAVPTPARSTRMCEKCAHLDRCSERYATVSASDRVGCAK
jgi:CRISPR-associated exonuclease Cas4